MRWLDKAVYQDTHAHLEVNDEVTVDDLKGLCSVTDSSTIVLVVGDVVDLASNRLENVLRATVTAVHPSDFGEATYDVCDGDGVVHRDCLREELKHRGKCWARVAKVHAAADAANDTYDLLDADNKELCGVRRSVLHKRKWISHAYACFSDDKLHDSYQTQHFLNKQLEDALANQDTSGSTDWLCDVTYNSETISLKKGDVVTVQDPSSNTEFRATVVKGTSSEGITVKTSKGAEQRFDRKHLRKHEVKIVYIMHSDNRGLHTCACVHVHMHAHMHTCMHVHMRTRIHARTHACTHEAHIQGNTSSV